MLNDYTFKQLYEIINMIVIYKPPKLQICFFLFILKKLLICIPLNCSITIIGDFNVNTLKKTSKLATLIFFMNKI